MDNRWHFPTDGMYPSPATFSLWWMLDRFDYGSRNAALTDADVDQLHRHHAGPIIHADAPRDNRKWR